MQNEIANRSSHKALDNVLIPSKTLRKLRAGESVVEQAKYRAQRLIKEAQQESERIRNEAQRIGYERGLLMSIESICQFIDNSSAYAHELYLKVREDIKDLLSDILDEETIILKILEQWVDELDKDDKKSPVCILMPYANRRFRTGLSRVVESKYAGSLVIEYHNEPRFVFKYKERLAEFYPEEFIYSTVTKLTGEIAFLPDNQRISSQAIQHLHEQLSLRYPLTNEIATDIQYNEE
ncbi:hypothetical protein [Cedecea davisae]|uniref:hypothetical protein n=1 Tax=Cedecea davisae TaxID=158484 RepID=UPI001D0AFCF2|nr:hypothetical protein [Cedecea davisae]